MLTKRMINAAAIVALLLGIRIVDPHPALSQDRIKARVGPICQTGPVANYPRDVMGANFRSCVQLSTKFEQASRYDNSGPVLFKPAPGRMTYQPAVSVCLSCIFVWRQFVYAFNVDIPSGNHSDAANNAAASEIQSAFAASAQAVLAKYTNTTSPGWIDEPDKICRAHRKKASLVLASPYFEDVEYCLRLIAERSGESEVPMGGHLDGPVRFRIEGEIVVAVTKNPNSPYRQPTDTEAVPFGDAIVKQLDATRSLIDKDVGRAGWATRRGAYPGSTIIIGRR